MNSFFRYPGGKGKLSDIISNKLILLSFYKFKGFIKNLEYREPFFGGGSVGLEFLCQTKMVNSVWINDKDNGIISLWNAIVNNPEELKDRIRNFIPTTDNFYSFKEELLKSTDCSVDIGFKKLVLHQISYSGLGTKSGGPLGGQNQKSDYKVDCRWSPFYMIKKIDKIRNILSTLNIKFTSIDFSDLITENGENVILYLDPPYYIKGNSLYQFGFSVEDHKRLSELLQKTNHKWILSYDDCEEVRELYRWAEIQKIHVNYTIKTSRMKPELIICQK